MGIKGRSISGLFGLGSRRKALDANGKVRILAPRKFRKMGRHYMDEVADAEIAREYLGIHDFETFERKTKAQIAHYKGDITKLEKLGVLSTEQEVRKRDFTVAIDKLTTELDAIRGKINEFRNA